MIRSMTAFALREAPSPWGVLACELRSVNHRYLELSLRLPEEFRALEPKLRELISARISRGKVDASGSLRQWTNGSLQALLEPTPSGDRLRLRTVKSSAPGMMLAGAGMTAASAVLIAISMQGGASLGGSLLALLPTGLAGLGVLLSSVLWLPRWARTRRAQMESIGTRLAPPDGG